MVRSWVPSKLRFTRRMVAAFAVLAGLFAVGPALAQGAIKETYGDWKLRCETPMGALGEQCTLEQYVVAEDYPGLFLRVSVYKATDGKMWFIRFLSPLNVMLQKEIDLLVNGESKGRLPFTRCAVVGCIATLANNEFIEQLKTSSGFSIIIYPTTDKGIGLPISLAGFAAGVENLP